MHSHTTFVLSLSTALSGLPGPPRLFFPRALSPLTPEMPSDCLPSVASSLVAGFILFGRLAAFISLRVNEAESGLLPLRLACLLVPGPASRIAPTHARTSYLLNGQLTR